MTDQPFHRDVLTPPLADDLTLSSVFRIRDLDHVDALYEGREAGFIYARDGHPNGRRLAEQLAELDKAEAGLVLSSGMAALAAVLLDRSKPGDLIVAGRELYGKTLSLLGDRLARFGVETTFVDTQDAAALSVALSRRPKLVLVESLTNPLLRATDLPRLGQQCRSVGALLVVDATFTPPPILRPIEWGADLVVHSLTKFLSGHGDVTLGSVVGSAAVIGSIAGTASTFGFHASAFDSWLTLRGLATLDLRAERACRNAMRLAQFLQSKNCGAAVPAASGFRAGETPAPQAGETFAPKAGNTHAPQMVRAVYYPGLAAHADHAWMSRHAPLFGFMLSFELAGDREAVNRLFRRLKTVPFCPSLGDTHTTVSHPASTSHRGLGADGRNRLGIDDGLVRVSVGVEAIDATIADFEQALLVE